MNKSMSAKSVRSFRPSILRTSNVETKPSINERPSVIERLSVVENKERPTLADRS